MKELTRAPQASSSAPELVSRQDRLVAPLRRTSSAISRSAAAALGLLCAAALAGGCSTAPKPERAPEESTARVEKTSGGSIRRTASGYSGVGWSLSPDTDKAAHEAMSHAGEDDGDLTMVFYTPQHNPRAIVSALRDEEHPSRRIIGMTSHDGILTAEGYHAAPTGVVGVLTMRMAGTTTGIGAASFDEVASEDKAGESARLALRRALEEAAKKEQRPSLIVLFGTHGHEEKMLAALTQESGPDVPLIGGSAAGPSSDIDLKKKKITWSMLANDKVLESGAAVAVFYTPRPVGTAYAGGFRREPSKSGVVTDAAFRLIRKIDGRPAVDVYDDWLGGRLKEARAAGEDMLKFCGFHPLARVVKKDQAALDQFLHVWPSEDPAETGSLRTASNVANGDVLFPSEGTWNMLLNRFAALPRQAKRDANEMTPAAGLFMYCGGALDTIPRDQRGNMGYLVAQSMGDMPWIGPFSWGEQGNIRGLGHLHGNLMASTILFPASEGAATK
ncbi:FIST N-terminal domain-containing protein [Sorangium sp. So ce136]|uniref:FIST signal transduction protein n=1 Tax=Sorangium sp. So ce136 TaxID=3133284 RepID=UPI003F04C80B